MTVFSEYRYYSPTLDLDAARISVADARGGEFYMIIPDHDDKSYRKARDQAIELIETAIDMGLEPGEVRVER